MLERRQEGFLHDFFGFGRIFQEPEGNRVYPPLVAPDQRFKRVVVTLSGARDQFLVSRSVGTIACSGRGWWVHGRQEHSWS
jgi:hypothetical protein